MTWQFKKNKYARDYSVKKNYLKGKRRELADMRFGELEKILDREFSFWVRAHETNEGYVQCITCKAWHRYDDIDAGHYIGRENRGTRWDPMNVQPQCASCNRFHEGEKAKFRAALVEKYGVEKVERMEKYASFYGNTRVPRETLIEQIKKYRELNKAIREGT